MADTPDVSQYNRDLNSERITFSNLRRDLRDALKGFSPPADVDEHLVLFAEEFGAEHTAKTLVTDPSHFGLTANPGDPALLALKPKLEAVHASTQRMDALVLQRETILRGHDPNRERVYISFGREFTIDAVNNLIRYVGSDEKEPLTMKVVEPRGAPARQAKRRREQDRDKS